MNFWVEAKRLFGKVGRFGEAGNTRPFVRPLRRATGICLLLLFLVGFAVAVYWPEAANTVVYQNGGIVVDASHSDQGYVMIARQSSKEQKLRISLGKANLTYDLNGSGAYEVFPLQLGNGKYTVEVFEKISGKKYSPAGKLTMEVTVPDTNTIYLYPNQYVWYDQNSQAVAKAQELCANATTDAAKVEAIYLYIVNNMVYDWGFASQVTSGKVKTYMPSVDRTLETGTGVCFDFSALMACMLRSQGVATQMGIGYADKIYHAWNYILVDGTWYQYDVTTAICQGSVSKYTPERIY